MEIFGFKTAWDLREKLYREFQELKAKTTDTDAAFIFFVTAESMRDWVYPGDANKGNRDQLLTSNPILEVSSHLANGMKHFELRESKKINKSIESTCKTGGYWASSYWTPSYWASSYFPHGALVVNLKDEAAIGVLGTEILNVVALAERVMEFWEMFSIDHGDLLPPSGR